MRSEHEVAIVGAGPAGSAAARALSAQGITALLLERKKLPRDKPCDGLIMEYVHEEILRSFGELPAEIYSDPPRIGGIRWHYGNELGAHDTVFDRPAHFVVRKDFDYWLNRMSGAEIRDQVTVLDVAMEGGVVRLRIRTPAGEEELICRYVVGADGDNGAVLRKLAPEFFAREVKPHRFMMGKVHYEGDIDLDKAWWHSFIDAEYGAMTLVTQKDATITIENCVKEAADFPMVHARLVEHLERTHGFRRTRVAKRELLARNQMAAMGIFHPGRGNVLLAGEASGLSRLWGEGIGPALVSGRQAGEAIATCMRSGRSAVQQYRPAFTRHYRAIAEEWNMIRLLVGRPGNVGQMDPKKAISELAFPQRWRLLSQLARQMGGFGGGRRVVGASLRSLCYPQERAC